MKEIDMTVPAAIACHRDESDFRTGYLFAFFTAIADLTGMQFPDCPSDAPHYKRGARHGAASIQTLNMPLEQLVEMAFKVQVWATSSKIDEEGYATLPPDHVQAGLKLWPVQPSLRKQMRDAGHPASIPPKKGAGPKKTAYPYSEFGSYTIIARRQRAGECCAFVDLEGKFDQRRAEQAKVDAEALLVLRPKSAQEAAEVIELLQRSQSVDFIVFSGMPQWPTHSLSA